MSKVTLPVEGSMMIDKMRSSTIIGAIIGDYVGSRFEFNNHKSKEFDFFHKDCKFTDDTVMTVAVYSALKEYEYIKKHKIVLPIISKVVEEELVRFGKAYPLSGYGGRFRRWLVNESRRPYGSIGNGAAMRISPVAYFYKDPFDIITKSYMVTAVTHNSEEGVLGAECVSRIINAALSGANKDEIKDIFRVYYSTRFTLDEIRDDYKFDETCGGTVPYAIEAFLESDSFEDAIRNAISIGGDSDTISCITGSIAGAYYGVPEEFQYEILNKLKDYTLLHETIKEIF